MKPKNWLTDEEYSKKLGSFCPRCNSDNVMPQDALQADEGYVFQNCSCNDCGLSWSDCYKIESYTPHFCDCTQPEMSTSTDEQYPRCLKCGCVEEPG